MITTPSVQNKQVPAQNAPRSSLLHYANNLPTLHSQCIRRHLSEMGTVSCPWYISCPQAHWRAQPEHPCKNQIRSEASTSSPGITGLSVHLGESSLVSLKLACEHLFLPGIQYCSTMIPAHNENAYPKPQGSVEAWALHRGPTCFTNLYGRARLPCGSAACGYSERPL